jgi:hypothetical protein
MLHLVHRCQVSAGLVMLGNLIHSFRRVQQLFVRVIFLPGISGSAKWTRNLERPRANRFVKAERSLQTRRIKQTTTASSASSAGTWAPDLRGKRPPARHHNCISGTPNQTASLCGVAESNLPIKRLLRRILYRKVSSRTARPTWSRHHVRLLFLPGITE